MPGLTEAGWKPEEGIIGAGEFEKEEIKEFGHRDLKAEAVGESVGAHDETLTPSAANLAEIDGSHSMQPISSIASPPATSITIPSTPITGRSLRIRLSAVAAKKIDTIARRTRARDSE